MSASEQSNNCRKRKDNPLWSEILQHSWEKVHKWASRVLDKWNFKISEVVKAGRQPQLRSAAVCAVYRDSGREKEVWRMACLMQHFDGHFRESLTEAQYRSLTVQWASGRLDSRLLPEVLAMRTDFRPHDLAFLVQDFSSPAVQQNFLEDASAKESSAKLEKLIRKLRNEQASFRRESALRKAADGNYLGCIALGSRKWTRLLMTYGRRINQTTKSSAAQTCPAVIAVWSKPALTSWGWKVALPLLLTRSPASASGMCQCLEPQPAQQVRLQLTPLPLTPLS